MSIFQVDFQTAIFLDGTQYTIGFGVWYGPSCDSRKRRSGSNDRTRFGAYVTCAVGSVTEAFHWNPKDAQKIWNCVGPVFALAANNAR
jgi:hypothetical protein